MSSGCGDVLSLEDLKKAKLHQIFEAEVITGKAGGVAGGASIDYATNGVTGQVQKTLPAVLRDLGYTPASFTFTTGGTLGPDDRQVAVLWPLASGGDGDWYYWEGILPKVIPSSSTPASTGGVADGAWRPVGDITLRGNLASASGASMIGSTNGTVQQNIDSLGSNITHLLAAENNAAAFETVISKITSGAVVKIACYGDSTTEGNGSLNWTARPSGQTVGYDPQYAYPALLGRTLKTISDNNNITVYNCGYGGQRIVDGWATDNFKSKIIDAVGTVDIVLIGFGINDAVYASFTPSLMRSNFEALILTALSYQCLPVLMSPNITGGTSADFLKKTAQIIAIGKSLAEKYGLRYIDQNNEQNKWLESSSDYLASLGRREYDLTHFDSVGYSFVASLIVKNLVPFIRTVKGTLSTLPAYLGKVKNRAATGGVGWLRDSYGRTGFSNYWTSSNAVSGDILVDTWIWNENSTSVLRYHAIYNDGWSGVAESSLPLISVYAASYDPDNIFDAASTIVAGNSLSTAGWFPSDGAQVLISGRSLPYGLVRVTYTIRANPTGLGCNYGYLSVCGDDPKKITVSKIFFSGSSTGDFSLTVPENTIKCSSGYGRNANRISLSGKMPQGTGVVLMQSRTYGDSNNQSQYSGLLLWRNTSNQLVISNLRVNTANGSFSITDSANSSSSYFTTDDYAMNVDLVKTDSAFTVNAAMLGYPVLTRTIATSGQVISTGGYHGSIVQVNGATVAGLALHNISIIA